MADSMVKQKSFEFALMVIGLYKQLQAENEYVISKSINSKLNTQNSKLLRRKVW